MKKLLAVLVLSLLFMSGCGKAPEEKPTTTKTPITPQKRMEFKRPSLLDTPPVTDKQGKPVKAKE